MRYLECNKAHVKELFSKGWMFYLGNLSLEEIQANQDFREVNLPHDWSVEYAFDECAETCGSGGYVKAGIGWYKKEFEIADLAKGKRITLNFDGAYMCSKVWLNGFFLGQHIYGYTPFEFDITELLDYDGKNVVYVMIDNSRQPNSRWYSGSGITRDVWLEAVSPIHIVKHSTYITTKLVSGIGKVKVQTEVDIPTVLCEKEKDIHAKIIINDSNGVEQARADVQLDGARKQAVDVTLDISNPWLWSDVSPYLYEMCIELYDGKEILDVERTRFGVRTVVFDPNKGLLLNGIRTKINGFCIHHDGGCLGAAVPRKTWERRLKKLKEMGANGLRCSHNPPDPVVLDLCDEMGFLVMDEAFDEWEILKGKELGSNTHKSRGYSEWFKDCYEEDMVKMLLRDRNHPSIIMWSIGNEIPEQTVEDGAVIAKRLKAICIHYDPERLVTLANDQIAAEPRAAREEFLNTLDIVGYNYVGRWRERAETLYDDDKRKHPEWCILGSENPSPEGRRGEYELESGRYLYYSIPVSVSKLLAYTMTHDYVAGDYVWTGIDYLGEAHWPERSSSFGLLDTAGFAKDSYFLYKSIWSEEPMIHAFPHWNVGVEEGRVIPVICYTNCDYAELFLNGKSFGKKSSSYPEYGMTEYYGHFDKTVFPANTNDLFLSWDVPYEKGSVKIIGYIDNKEACCFEMQTTNEAYAIEADTDVLQITADGRDIAHIEIKIVDIEGRFVPNANCPLLVEVEGCGKLIGLDNGNPKCLESFKGFEMHTYNGLLLAIIQAGEEEGDIRLRISCDGLKGTEVVLQAKK